MAANTITVTHVLEPLGGQLEQTAEDQYASFARREPVILTHLIGAPVLGLVALFAPGQADQLSAQVTAAVVALVVALQGFLVRRYVAPAWTRATRFAFPDPAGYSDAYDDGTGVPHPSSPPVSLRSPDDGADELTGVIPLPRPHPTARHEAAGVAASSNDASFED